MTKPLHGQVPEALIDLIDAYAETRHRCGGIYNAKTEAARKAAIEALSGVQALSAAPAGFVPVAAFDRLHAHAESLAARLLAASPTPPAEQQAEQVIIDFSQVGTAGPFPVVDGRVSLPDSTMQDLARMLRPTFESERQATKETSGGFHVWRDISTAPKDGSRFVATGHNYGLYSEGRHACVAQWFRGSWIEASEWNETSELKYLTHWMPLPSPPDDVAAPAEQQAAPKAAPVKACVCGEPQASGTVHRVDGPCYVAAPQQEAQEPSNRDTVDVVGVRSNGEHVNLGKIAMPPRMKAREIAIEQFGSFKDDDGSDAEMCFGALEYFLEWLIQQGWSKAPQPAPAPLSDDVVKDAARYRWLRENWFTMTSSYQRHITFKVGEPRWSDITEEELDAAIDAALAAQGGKDAG